MTSRDRIPTKVCSQCKQDKPIRLFYKGHDECRICTVPVQVRQPLYDAVEAHRQSKIAKKIERELLKKVAKARIQARKQKKREQAVKELLPPVIEKPIQVDAATKELAQRELSRRRLIEFIQEFHPRYKAGWVHHDICRRLEKFSQ